MLTNSFLHIRGVGPLTERRIWQRGVQTWQTFLADPRAAGLSANITARIAESVACSVDCLQRDDHRFFAIALPRREHWRAYPEFSHRVAYLDIETTALQGDDVTLIGVYDGERVRTYMKGQDLHQFAEDIADYSLLVTYYGACFDLPFLRRRFADLILDQLHIDLCPVLRRLGLTGGLKNIERQLDIQRSPETSGLDGWDAVRLWREWERGSKDALELLKRYNGEDVVNLETLMRYAYQGLRAQTGLLSPA